MQSEKTEINVKGRQVSVDVTMFENIEIITAGNGFQTAKAKEEWDVDITDPELVVRHLKDKNVKADIFTFMQRLPESAPKYRYFMEWDNVAAIPVTGFDAWWKSQITQEARNKVRKAAKNSVEVKRVEFTDTLVTQIMEIYDETPIRQGKPFWDYNKDFNEVKTGNATYLDRAVFLGAYFNDELIGFIKLVDAGRYMRTMGILSKIKYRDKAPTNALVSKAVEICAGMNKEYLVYGRYKYGRLGSDTLNEFKKSNGFENILLPRYYLPLTAWGSLILGAGCHAGIIQMMPDSVINMLKNVRNKWYLHKFKPAH